MVIAELETEYHFANPYGVLSTDTNDTLWDVNFSVRISQSSSPEHVVLCHVLKHAFVWDLGNGSGMEVEHDTPRLIRI